MGAISTEHSLSEPRTIGTNAYLIIAPILTMQSPGAPKHLTKPDKNIEENAIMFLLRTMQISINQSLHSAIYLSICINIYLSIYLSIYLTFYLFTFLPFYLSTFPPFYLSTFLPFYLYIFLPFCLSTVLLSYLSTSSTFLPFNEFYFSTFSSFLPFFLSTFLPFYLSSPLSLDANKHKQNKLTNKQTNKPHGQIHLRYASTKGSLYANRIN